MCSHAIPLALPLPSLIPPFLDLYLSPRVLVVSCVCACARVLCLAFVFGYVLAESLRGGPVPMMHEDIGPQQITVTTRRIVDVPHEQPAMRVAGLGGNGVSGLPPGARVVKTTKYPPGHHPSGMGVSLGTTQQISLGNPQQIPFGSPAPHRPQSTVSTIATTVSMSSPSRGIDQQIFKDFRASESGGKAHWHSSADLQAHWHGSSVMSPFRREASDDEYC